MPNTLPTGYKPKKKKPKKKRNYIASLVIPDKKKIGISERVIKILIFLALRLVIKPSKWKQPEKNYEIIDRVYKRIVGADFVYIPSSIAFYMVMAFMPILAIIIVIASTPYLNIIFTLDDVASVLGKFIPGISFIIKQISDYIENNKGNITTNVVGISLTLFLFIISTWIAAGGMSKLVFTQSYIYGHKYVGGWWMNRFRGMFMVILLSMLLVISLTINIHVSNLIYELPVSNILKQIIKYVFLIFGLLTMLFILFILFFKMSPRFKIKIREVIPGAMVAALPTAIFLSLFAVIAVNISYEIYGFLSIVMYVGLISIWITTFIFLGIITNAAYFRTHVNDKPTFKWTLSNK